MWEVRDPYSVIGRDKPYKSGDSHSLVNHRISRRKYSNSTIISQTHQGHTAVCYRCVSDSRGYVNDKGVFGLRKMLPGS